MDEGGATVKKDRVEPNILGGFTGFFADFPEEKRPRVFATNGIRRKVNGRETGSGETGSGNGVRETGSETGSGNEKRGQGTNSEFDKVSPEKRERERGQGTGSGNENQRGQGT